MNIFSKFAVRSLRKNRSRTFFSLVGITLATAMITAVMTGISSLYQYLLEIARLKYSEESISAYLKESPLFRTASVLSALVLAIIVASAVILIYNAFSISINERKKQYGLLSSLGATKKQLRMTIVTEASFTCIIGVPLGILLGIGGLTGIFYLLRRQLTEVLQTSGSIPFRLSAAPWAILIACAISFATVLTAAYIPARKALNMPAIEVIRQTADTNTYNPKKLRTPRITRILFGLEGDIATKNYKRCRRKYRTTVFSIFLSIVLFISSNSFCCYLTDSIRAVIEDFQCDIWLNGKGVTAGNQTETLFARLNQSPGVTNGEYHYLFEVDAFIPTNTINKTFRDKYIPASYNGETVGKTLCNNIGIIFLNDDVYNSFIEKEHLDPSKYGGSTIPNALVYNTSTTYDNEQKHYTICNFFKTKPETVEIVFATNRHVTLDGREYHLDDSFTPYIQSAEHGKYEVQVISDDTEAEEQWTPLESVCDIKELSLGDTIKSLPPGLDHESAYLDLTLIYPERVLQTIAPNPERVGTYMTFTTDNHTESYASMQNILAGSDDYRDAYLYNVAKRNQTNRAYILTIRVFTYGFLFLILVISATNILNVISANVILRRREFAMLRSVGMTRSGFYKMAIFESLLYGGKGILTGLPVSVGLSALLWYLFIDSVEFSFYIPWKTAAIAVAAVFAVIIGTMLYTMHYIQKGRMMEQLHL